ncbi:MAG: lytic transglycosylase domain-containing protein [Opitutaceae bacterium]|nr:lytic transglycosylase domain-containing protein [Opitutaceae bacterium]
MDLREKAGVRTRVRRRSAPRFLLAGLLAAAVGAGCGRRPPLPEDPATPETVWEAIHPLAARYRLEPAYVYAIVAAESNFDPRARNGEARGLMQLKPAAWRTVSREPYEPAVWDWRRNLAAGIDYLAWCRSYLHEKSRFSEPLLLAAFHYGIDYVEERGFDPGRIERPVHPVYRRLWAGDLAPVPPPKAKIPR